MCKAYGPISVKLQGWEWAQAGNLIAMNCLYSGICDHYFFLVEFVTNLKTLKTLWPSTNCPCSEAFRFKCLALAHGLPIPLPTPSPLRITFNNHFPFLHLAPTNSSHSGISFHLLTVSNRPKSSDNVSITSILPSISNGREFEGRLELPVAILKSMSNLAGFWI